MTPKEQRIAISEVCGWHDVKERPHPLDETIKMLSGYLGVAKYLAAIPDYPSDLNAIHSAEKVLTAGYQWCSYYFHLKKITDATANEGWLEHGTVTATAAQRAEAFLKTLNLWKEDARIEPEKPFYPSQSDGCKCWTEPGTTNCPTCS